MRFRHQDHLGPAPWAAHAPRHAPSHRQVGCCPGPHGHPGRPPNAPSPRSQHVWEHTSQPPSDPHPHPGPRVPESGVTILQTEAGNLDIPSDTSCSLICEPNLSAHSAAPWKCRSSAPPCCHHPPGPRLPSGAALLCPRIPNPFSLALKVLQAQASSAPALPRFLPADRTLPHLPRPFCPSPNPWDAPCPHLTCAAPPRREVLPPIPELQPCLNTCSAGGHCASTPMPHVPTVPSCARHCSEPC